MTGGLMGFFKTLCLSINPFSYHEFAQKEFSLVMRYFISVILLAFVVVNVLLLPFYLGLPNMVSQSLSHFETFDVDTTIEMSKPIEIPKQEAVFVIDTTGSIDEMKNERVILTKDYIYYRMFLENKRISIDRLLDIVNYRADATWSIMSILGFLAPSVIFYSLLGLFLKYFVLIFLTTLLVFFIIRVLFLFEISFKNALASTFYAGTMMILIEAIVFPLNYKLLFPLFSFFGLKFYLVSYLVFFVFSLLGLLFLEKDIKFSKKKKHQKESKDHKKHRED